MTTQLNDTHAPTDGAAQPGRGTGAWTLVARREIAVRLKDKTFLMTTAFSLVLVGLIFGVQVLIGGSSGTDYRVAVTDDDGAAIVDAAEPAILADDEESTLATSSVEDRAAGEALLQEEEADALLVPGDSGWELVTVGDPDSTLQVALQGAVQLDGLESTAEELGTTVPDLLAGTELTSVSIDSDGDELLYFLASMAFAVLFYFAALMFGLNIANSVVEEKQSRIIEILAAMIPTRALLIGKVVGNTVLAFGQMALLAGIALVGMTFVDLPFEISGLTEAVLWFIPFFIFGFLALACVWAAVGAMASRIEDLQSSTMPLTLVLVGAFFAALYLEGTAERIASYVPILSTLMMPGRVLSGDAQWYDALLALGLVVVFAGVVVLLAERFYRRSLLQTQGRLSFRQAMKLTD